MENREKEAISKAAIKEYVTAKRDTANSFTELAEGFPELIKLLHKPYALRWKTFFGKGIGVKSSKKLLIKHGKSEWFEEGDDFQGISVWYHEDQPFYVGISRKVLYRVGSHAKVTNHFTASMAYKIANEIHPSELSGRAAYEKSRIAKVQEWLKDQYVAILPIPSADQLALFEIYCPMELGCRLNVFETH